MCTQALPDLQAAASTLTNLAFVLGPEDFEQVEPSVAAALKRELRDAHALTGKLINASRYFTQHAGSMGAPYRATSTAPTTGYIPTNPGWLPLVESSFDYAYTPTAASPAPSTYGDVQIFNPQARQQEERGDFQLQTTLVFDKAVEDVRQQKLIDEADSFFKSIANKAHF